MPSELDRRVEELASEQLDHFSVRQLLLLGANQSHIHHRVTSGRWRRARRGVLCLRGAPDTFETRLMAALLAAPVGAAASHRGAAGVFHVPGFDAFLELTLRSTHAVRLPHVTVHRSNLLPERHVRLIGAIRTTSVARTLFDLRAVIRPERLERAIDNALSKRMVTVPSLSTMSHELAARGRRKLSVVRAILGARGGNYIPPASELEAEFRDLLTRFGLPQADRQVNLGNGDAWLGRVDFLFRSARLVIEVDGNEFHSALLDRRADAERDRSMIGAGWKVLRFGWHDVTTDASRVAITLRNVLRDQGQPSNSDLCANV